MAARFFIKAGKLLIAVGLLLTLSGLLKTHGLWPDITLGQLMSVGVYFIFGWNLGEWARK